MEAYVLLISGRVQGVGFRWFTEQEALERGLRGYVRNLPDGRVEVRAQGDEEILEEFFDRLRQGPPGARVEDVERRKVSVEPGLSSFHVSF